MNLSDYGILPYMIPDDKKLTAARVTAVHKGRFEIFCEHGISYAKLKSSVYYNSSDELFPTVGDFVTIEYNDCGDSIITSTLDRKTFFSRRDPDEAVGEQAVAANFDYVFIMQSLNHDFNIKRLERYLTLSWQSNAMPVIVLTKADLADDIEESLRQAQNAAAIVPVIAISAKTGYGLSELNEYLKKGKTVVFLGSSGVGKSSLVNALLDDSLMKVNDIRQNDSKGRHTTTHRQLIMLNNGAMLIDTPGMRELGMWDVTKGLSHSFSDVEQYFGLCKFSDCKHESEPGCAVKKAIKNKELSEERWQSYQKLKKEAKYSDDKSDYLASKRTLFKDIAKANKHNKKA